MFRPVVRGISGQRHGHRSLAPGEQWSEIHYIHHNWKNVPSGKAALEVVWPVFEPGREGKEVARPTAKLDINIPVATQARVHALCQRLEERLGNGNSTENERQVVIHEVIDYVQYTTHAELAPIVWRLIESFPNQSPVHDFIPMVYAAGNDKGIVNRRLIKLACDLNYPDLDDIFWYWRRERVTLSTDEMTPLLQSENVWTRAMTGATFTDRCGKEWMEQLFRDLRARSNRFLASSSRGSCPNSTTTILPPANERRARFRNTASLSECSSTRPFRISRVLRLSRAFSVFSMRSPRGRPRSPEKRCGC